MTGAYLPPTLLLQRLSGLSRKVFLLAVSFSFGSTVAAASSQASGQVKCSKDCIGLPARFSQIFKNYFETYRDF